MKSKYLLAMTCLLTLVPTVTQAGYLGADVVWSYSHGGQPLPSATTSEIVAFDPQSQRIFVAGGTGVDVLDKDGNRLFGLGGTGTGNPSTTTEVTSVAVANGFVAVSALITKSDGGSTSTFGGVQIYTTAGALVHEVRTTAAGDSDTNTPDTVHFTPDGSKIVVANEGESGQGSVAVIDVASGNVQRASFGAFDTPTQRATLVQQGVLLDSAQTLDDQLQPEYVAVSADGKTAYVTLQEANAVAVVDLSGAAPVVTEIRGLGLIDRGVPGQGFDPSNQDGKTEVRNFANLFSSREADQIETFQSGGKTYYITANEGDDGTVNFLAGANVVAPASNGSNLDPVKFPNAATLMANANLGRLDLNGIDTDNDGDIDQLLATGGRSISIFDDAGNLVWDSGDGIEQALITLGLLNDGRSDNRGPEPEGLTLGEIDGKLYAFVSIERGEAVMVFDITDPTNGLLVDTITLTGGLAFDEPEGLAFIKGSESWDGNTYLLVSSEGSGETFLLKINVPEPASVALFAVALGGLGTVARRRRRA